MFLAEYLKTLLSASIAFDRSNVNMGKKLHSNFAQTLIQQKERTNRFVAEMFSLFFVRRYVCKQTRYTRFARAIYCRFAPMRYDINPLTPKRAYRKA